MYWSHIEVFEKFHEILNFLDFTQSAPSIDNTLFLQFYTYYLVFESRLSIISGIPLPVSLSQLGSFMLPHLVGIEVFYLCLHVYLFISLSPKYFDN